MFILPVIAQQETLSESPGKLESHLDTATTAFAGYTTVSFINMIRATGYTPPYYGLSNSSSSAKDIPSLCRRSKRPLVLFPEFTTSNGRGLLHFSDLENIKGPHGFNIFIMGVR